MADPRKRLADNVPGEFYVDSTCIDCGTCRRVAPRSFAESDDASRVYAQPTDEATTRAAIRALLSCPTASIGSEHNQPLQEVMKDFPLPIDDDVFFMGFTSRKSFGASSYFIRHPEGNWMIDSPRFLPLLQDAIARMGGLRYIFLTHQDDVADAPRFAERFGAERILHRWDLGAQPGAEIVLEGEEPVELVPRFKIIPTPGHTHGHCVLLVRDTFLFSGDHLMAVPEEGRLGAYRGVCWYSWPEQTRSMEKLLKERFEWVLPGHGMPDHLSADEMHQRLEALVRRMRTTL